MRLQAGNVPSQDSPFPLHAEGSPRRSVAEDHKRRRFCEHSQVLPWLKGEAGKGPRGESLPQACQLSQKHSLYMQGDEIIM